MKEKLNIVIESIDIVIPPGAFPISRAQLVKAFTDIQKTINNMIAAMAVIAGAVEQLQTKKEA